MKAALYSGLLNPPSPETGFLKASCSTGNCTWPITPSLGVCGECADTTSHVTTTCYSEYDCIYTYPGSVWGYANASLYPTNTSDTKTDIFKVARVSGVGLNYTKELGDNALGTYVAFGNHVNNSLGFYMHATECTLWLCVKAFNVSVTAGVQSQSVVDTYNAMPDHLQSGEALPNLFNFTNIPASFNVAPDTTFSIGDRALFQAIPSAIDNVLLGTVLSNVDGSELVYLNGQTSYESQYQSTSDTLPSIWLQYPNLNPLIQSLALSMTIDMIQSAAAPRRQHYAGSAISTEPYVHVRWGWLAFPAAMVVASALFLSASILQTKARGLEPWKSSPFALLFCDMDPDVVPPNSVLAGKRSERVILSKKEGRWGFERRE